MNSAFKQLGGLQNLALARSTEFCWQVFFPYVRFPGAVEEATRFVPFVPVGGCNATENRDLEINFRFRLPRAPAMAISNLQ